MKPIHTKQDNQMFKSMSVSKLRIVAQLSHLPICWNLSTSQMFSTSGISHTNLAFCLLGGTTYCNASLVHGVGDQQRKSRLLESNENVRHGAYMPYITVGLEIVSSDTRKVENTHTQRPPKQRNVQTEMCGHAESLLTVVGLITAPEKKFVMRLQIKSLESLHHEVSSLKPNVYLCTGPHSWIN